MAQDPITEALRSVFAPIVKQSAKWHPVLAYGLPGIVAVLLIIALGLVVPLSLIWLMAVVVLAPLAGYIVVDRNARRDPQTVVAPYAAIDFPKDNNVVGRTIYCTGFASGIRPNTHIWMAIEALGFIWPKEQEVFLRDSRWNHKIFEDGATRKFSVVLLLADSRGDKIIRDWLDAGKEEGEYSQMKGIPGTQTLDRVTGLYLMENA